MEANVRFASKYGHFTEDGLEYILTRPDPPRPWFNYFGHATYAVRFSQTGGGTAKFMPPDGNVVNPTHPLFDKPGRYVYIRDNETDRFWTTNWMPVQAPYETFRCRHGLGYSEIDSISFGVRSRLHVFVPLDDPAEIWTIGLANRSGRKRSLSVFTFMELVLAGHTGTYDLPIFSSRADYLADEKLILGAYDDLSNGERFEYFVRPGFEIDGFDCRREDFIGIYNDYANPQHVVHDRSCDHNGHHEPLVAAFHKRIELAPGEECTLDLLAGVSQSPQARAELIEKYSDPESVRRQLERLRDDWGEKIRRVVVDTPDDAVNLYANVWLKSAVAQCNTWVRGPTSNSNFGYRDVMQDARGIVTFDPERTREAILKAMPYQYADGSALRQWAKDPLHHDRRRFADSPLWIAFAVCGYARQTGRTDLLEIERAYLDGGAETVYAHMLAGLRRISRDTGAHGLPRIHEGDWNDGLGLIGAGGEGESVWLAMAVITANAEAAELARFLGDEPVEAELSGYNRALAAAVNGPGWDGKWYRRAFTDAGRAVGTDDDENVTLWLNPQVWAILSGVADAKRTQLIRQVVEQRLRTPVGYLLFDPPFSEYRPDIGYYSLLIPRQWNYVHASAFKFAAECKGGFADAAYETLRLILPLAHDPDATRAEPYAFPNYYVVSDPGRIGRSLFGWFTGTCSWVLTGIVEGMLGIQPGYTGLRINPCLPTTWDRVGAEVALRGARYAVEIHNPDGKNTGVKRMRVDSQEIAGTELPYFTDGGKHTVEAWL